MCISEYPKEGAIADVRVRLWVQYAAKSVATAAVATAVSLSLSGVASAVDVKLGSDGGALVFEPSEVTISAGDTVTWINNVGYPHNVVFDEDEIPDGIGLCSLTKVQVW